MAQDQPTGVWLRDGNLIYMLTGSGIYKKGVELPINKHSIRIAHTAGTTVAEVDALAEKIYTFLVNDAKEKDA